MRQVARQHPVAAFLVLAYAFSWATWIPLLLRGDVVIRGDGWPTHLLGLMGPALAAVVVTALADGRPGVRDLAGRMVRWRVAPGWYLLALLTLALGVGTAAIRDAGVDWSREAEFAGAPQLVLPVIFLVVLVVNGFGEETGWRGFAADRLLRRHGQLTTALLVTVAWGLWHVPLFFLVASFQGLGLAVVGWAIGLACGSIVLTWMYAGTGRSIFVVALWHTSFNFASGTTLMDGLPAAVTSAVVMVLAAVLVLRGAVATRDRRPSGRCLTR